MQNLTKTNKTNTTEFTELLKEQDKTPIYYTILISGTVVFELLQSIAFFYFITKISIVLHNNIFTKIMKATMGFFDSHLSGSILNRFAKDMTVIDDYLPYVYFEVVLVSNFEMHFTFYCFEYNFLFLGIFLYIRSCIFNCLRSLYFHSLLIYLLSCAVYWPAHLLTYSFRLNSFRWKK